MGVKTWLRDNGLSIALLGLFTLSFVGQVAAGLAAGNHERIEHGRAALGLLAYLRGGEFLSAVFENWESEFLQMGVYVVLTAYLFQRGSPESRDPGHQGSTRAPTKRSDRPDAPWPVRRGGLALRLYEHSLGLAMFALFLASFVLHWVNSARAARDEAIAHHQPPPGFLEHLVDPQLWFESFQNWQSEFLSTAMLVILAIVLREKGSPESKPVAAPHGQTGG
jgi:hypothetical protein